MNYPCVSLEGPSVRSVVSLHIRFCKYTLQVRVTVMDVTPAGSGAAGSNRSVTSAGPSSPSSV